ncbi:hypothetical protein LZ32DRAFT_388075 [Colletotrichum eremochloae]|nr:hypothetical protein LZ32DRAFT_388075 [Colletotrichum eremochloae]
MQVVRVSDREERRRRRRICYQKSNDRSDCSVAWESNASPVRGVFQLLRRTCSLLFPPTPSRVGQIRQQITVRGIRILESLQSTEGSRCGLTAALDRQGHETGMADPNRAGSLTRKNAASWDILSVEFIGQCRLCRERTEETSLPYFLFRVPSSPSRLTYRLYRVGLLLASTKGMPGLKVGWKGDVCILRSWW